MNGRLPAVLGAIPLLLGWVCCRTAIELFSRSRPSHQAHINYILESRGKKEALCIKEAAFIVTYQLRFSTLQDTLAFLTLWLHKSNFGIGAHYKNAYCCRREIRHCQAGRYVKLYSCLCFKRGLM